MSLFVLTTSSCRALKAVLCLSRSPLLRICRIPTSDWGLSPQRVCVGRLSKLGTPHAVRAQLLGVTIYKPCVGRKAGSLTSQAIKSEKFVRFRNSHPDSQTPPRPSHSTSGQHQRIHRPRSLLLPCLLPLHTSGSSPQVPAAPFAAVSLHRHAMPGRDENPPWAGSQSQGIQIRVKHQHR